MRGLRSLTTVGLTDIFFGESFSKVFFLRGLRSLTSVGLIDRLYLDPQVPLNRVYVGPIYLEVLGVYRRYLGSLGKAKDEINVRIVEEISLCLKPAPKEPIHAQVGPCTQKISKPGF